MMDNTITPKAVSLVIREARQCEAGKKPAQVSCSLDLKLK